MQLGIGAKNGAEIGGRMAQLVFDSEDNHVLLSLDNENGFNTLPRGLICSGLAEFAPELLHWFQYAYGGPSPLFCQGELVAHMATGCKQGDTFGRVPLVRRRLSVRLPFSPFRILSPFESKTMPVVVPRLDHPLGRASE